MRYYSRVLWCLHNYDPLGSSREVFHDLFEVAESEKVEFLVFHKVIFYSFLQILNFAGQLVLFSLEIGDLGIQGVNLATNLGVLSSSHPAQFVLVHLFNIPNPL